MTIAEQLIEEGRQAYKACLQAATPAALDRYLERVLIADSLAAVFAD